MSRSNLRKSIESDRRAAHQSRGDRTFMDQVRMRRIRWEESVVRREAKDDGLTEYAILHLDCSCGSADCRWTPIAREI